MCLQKTYRENFSISLLHSTCYSHCFYSSSILLLFLASPALYLLLLLFLKTLQNQGLSFLKLIEKASPRFLEVTNLALMSFTNRSTLVSLLIQQSTNSWWCHLWSCSLNFSVQSFSLCVLSHLHALLFLNLEGESEWGLSTFEWAKLPPC